MINSFKKFYNKKVFTIGIVFILSLAFINNGFSEERRNPFENWFPVIKTETKEQEEQPLVFVEQEKIFDVSLYNLEGLIWSTKKPKAIINNKIYNVGDKLGEAEIKKIDKEGVSLLFNEKEYFITTKQKINAKKSN